jgi:LacI family transcriptional regulator
MHTKMGVYSLTFAHNKGMKNVTDTDIARELGLSRNTVSKVLNGKKMPEKTKQLVLSKAKELNYKQLSSEESRAYKILLLSGKPLRNFDFFVPIIRAIEDLCYQRGYQLFQYVCTPGINANDYLADHIAHMQFDGLICIEIFSREFIQTILNFNVPAVFLDAPVNLYGGGRFDIVLQDNYTPIEKELNRLAEECGVRSIGFVGDPDHCLSFQERYESVLITCGLHDFPHRKEMDFLFPDGHVVYQNRYAMAREINTKPLCDAYVCANDFIARQFIQALNIAGYSVPENIKVIGFDYTPDSYGMRPSITSVSVEPKSIADAIILAIRNRILNPQLSKTLNIVHSKLILKESTQVGPKEK